MKSEETFKELSAYSQVAERMIERSGKADIAEVARILASSGGLRPALWRATAWGSCGLYEGDRALV